jgi:glycerol-3-phosphate acyltransferase PlsX
MSAVSGTRVNLALDANGGDHGIDVTLPAALEALSQEPELNITLVGVVDDIEERVEFASHTRLKWGAAESGLAADAGPLAAIRKGAGSGTGRAIQMVADKAADACVSAGNTAALVALGVKRLGVLPGLRRPALMSDIPCEGGMTSVLDLGANLDVDARQLMQFAIMGVEARTLQGGPPPRVGLLNVGHEEGKGHAVVQEAHGLLRELPLNYVGFIEGHDIYAGKADVAVCDGFAGNLLLKSSEGLARMLFNELKEVFRHDFRSRCAGLLAKPALRSMLEQLDPGKHNGAALLGLGGVVVKSHGSADATATVHAIREAMREAQRQVPDRIKEAIQRYGAGEST